MPTIAFDLDGTLIDTAPDLVDALNYVLTPRGLKTVPLETAKRLIGGGVKVTIKRALDAEHHYVSADELDRIYADFITYYAAHLTDRSRPFPHLEIILDQLTAAGHRLAVCTNKLEWLSRRLLDAFKLTSHFIAICGQDTFGVQKPDPEILRRTVERAGGDLAHAIMIGDSGTDIRLARACAVPVIAVNFGYTDVPIASLRPDRIIGSFTELPAAIRAISAERPIAPVRLS